MKTLKTNLALWAFIFLACNATRIESAEGQDVLRLERTQLERAQLNQEKREQGVLEQCAICLEEVPASNLFETNCSHLFHVQCLDLTQDKSTGTPKLTCPLCKVEMPQSKRIQITIEARLEEEAEILALIDERIATNRKQMRSAEEAGNQKDLVNLAKIFELLTAFKQKSIADRDDLLKNQEELRSFTGKATVLEKAQERFEAAQKRAPEERRTNTQLPIMRYRAYVIALTSSYLFVNWLFAEIRRHTEE